MNLLSSACGQLRLTLVLLIIIGGLLRADHLGLPDATDPVAGMGVNIHFLDAQPGEMEMLSQAGFHVTVGTDVSGHFEGEEGIEPEMM